MKELSHSSDQAEGEARQPEVTTSFCTCSEYRLVFERSHCAGNRNFECAHVEVRNLKL